MSYALPTLLVLSLALVAGCTGPQEVVHYSCTHGMRLDVTYEEATQIARVHDMIGQVRVLSETSADATGTIYGDSAVQLIRNNDGTVVYAARDSHHDSVTCAPPKLSAALVSAFE
ncbi:MAG: hypothetical protein ACP5M5_09615 [Acidibrevibacterium sp.]|uniref:hypothetical protein n=1 Tax=Acidibrevibacterium sp. TaxID=2606776 RepID=UPI003D02BFA1